MHTKVKDQKQELRKKCKAIRLNLGTEARQAGSLAICARLSTWDVLKQAEVILTYMPMRTEVDLRPLLVKFPEKRWLIPRILSGENGQMVFHPFEPEHLVLHPFGMAEPASTLPQISPSEIQLVLVPGLAYDGSGWRLGYGGGFYDRFLSKFEGVSVGIVFKDLLLERLPHGEFDVRVGWIVSESELTERI